MKSSLPRWLAISAGLGLVPPAVWFFATPFAGADVMPYFQLAIVVVWPSSLWLLATDGIGGTPRAYLFVGMAVLANMILYAVLGGAAWRVWRSLGARG